MSLVARVFVITICINLVLSLSFMSLGGNEVINRFLLIDNSTNQITPTGDYLDTIPTTTEQGFASTGTTLSFIDGLRMAGNFILTMLFSLFMPIYWSFALNMPWFMGVLLFILSGLSTLSLVMLIRGVGA